MQYDPKQVGALAQQEQPSREQRVAAGGWQGRSNSADQRRGQISHASLGLKRRLTISNVGVNRVDPPSRHRRTSLRKTERGQQHLELVVE